jgi:hypothetical protein
MLKAEIYLATTRTIGHYETDRDLEAMETDIAKLNAHIAGRFTTKRAHELFTTS